MEALVMSDTVMYWNGFITAGLVCILAFWWYIQYYQEAEVPFGAQEIVSNLWLGSFEDSLKVEELKKRNVKRVLSITFGTYPIHADDFDYLIVRCMDEESQNIASYFEEANKYIEEARAAGEGVFVHCMQGISRSSSFVAAYLLSRPFRPDELLGCDGDDENSQRDGVVESSSDSVTPEPDQEVAFGLEDALAVMKSRRDRVNPNAGFIRQLQDYEKRKNRKRKGKDGEEREEKEGEVGGRKEDEESKEMNNIRKEWKAELYRYSKATQEVVCLNPHELQDLVERLRAFAFHTFLRFYNFHFRRFHRYLKNKSPKHHRRHQQLEQAWKRARNGRRGSRRYPLSDQDEEEEVERKRRLFFGI